jgi:hypothetical protein
MSSTVTSSDLNNLEGLRRALLQHHSFGVGTDPRSPNDATLHASMLRLEAAWLIRRASEDKDLGIWWQAVFPY